MENIETIGSITKKVEGASTDFEEIKICQKE
mgnify:CR=1 FL=1